MPAQAKASFARSGTSTMLSCLLRDACLPCHAPSPLHHKVRLRGQLVYGPSPELYFGGLTTSQPGQLEHFELTRDHLVVLVG